MGISIVVDHELVFFRGGPRAKVTVLCCIKRSTERPDFCAEHLVINPGQLDPRNPARSVAKQLLCEGTALAGKAGARDRLVVRI